MSPGRPCCYRRGAVNMTAATRGSWLLENRTLATDFTGLANSHRWPVKQAVLPDGGYHRFSTAATGVGTVLTKDHKMSYGTKDVIIQHI